MAHTPKTASREAYIQVIDSLLEIDYPWHLDDDFV